jgi:alkanesulfonate monooxygenase SsuD/methylene tetrahydromethanopterin reductase-like flavin-dependent oxidoreductase (luciferase family)
VSDPSGAAGHFPAVGVVLQREVAPEDVANYARLIEDLGYDDIWIVEDLHFAGAIATAAAVLAATRRVTVGIGILPATVRNPVFAAMELAALLRGHPGRELIVGLGHGIPEWMAAVGAATAAPVATLVETIGVVRRLLAGDTVDLDGDTVTVHGARLEFPPAQVPRLLAGVRGPRSLQALADVADGVLLAEPSAPGYVAWARRQLGAAADTATVATYDWLSVDDDRATALDRLRSTLAHRPGGLAEPGLRRHLEPLAYAEELRALIDRAPDESALAAGLAPAWIADLAVAGTPDDCRRALERRGAAGATRTALHPDPGRRAEQLRALAAVLPGRR